MDGAEAKDLHASATYTLSTRLKRYKQQRLDDLDCTKPTMSAVKHDDLAPTATALLNKERQELTFLKEKLEWQKMRVEELEGERDFLRSQRSSLTKQPKDKPFNDPFFSKASENSSASTSSSVSSVLLSSSSSLKKNKHKYKKNHSRAKKYKKEQKLRQRGEQKILVEKIVQKRI